MRRARAPGRADLALQRREEILDASERVFADKGYHATGIADIADELGLGHGTFYRYFKSKHDIALQVVDRLLKRFAEIGLAENPEAANTLDEYRAQTRRILLGWLALTDERSHLLRLFHEQLVAIEPARLSEVIEAYVEYTERFLRNGVDKRFLRADLEVRATAEMLVALIFEGTRRALTSPDAELRRRWVDAGMRLMFDGVRA